MARVMRKAGDDGCGSNWNKTRIDESVQGALIWDA